MASVCLSSSVLGTWDRLQEGFPSFSSSITYDQVFFFSFKKRGKKNCPTKDIIIEVRYRESIVGYFLLSWNVLSARSRGLILTDWSESYDEFMSETWIIFLSRPRGVPLIFTIVVFKTIRRGTFVVNKK